MPAPDLIAPDRLEELLGGALPEGEREARLQGLVRELRAEAPPVPPTLLERVREIGQAAASPQARRVPAAPAGGGTRGLDRRPGRLCGRALAGRYELATTTRRAAPAERARVVGRGARRLRPSATVPMVMPRRGSSGRA